MKKTKKKSTIKNTVKAISSVIVGYGVGEIVGSILKDFTPSARGLKKLAIKAGALAITGMAVVKVSDFVEHEVDDIFDIVEEVSNKVEANTQEKEVDVE